jgi:hypothetical protein
MNKVSVEAVKFTMAGVRHLRRSYQIRETARILGVHEDTVRNRLKKPKPKKQYKRRAARVVSNGIEIAVSLTDDEIAAAALVPDDDVIKALREHMGAELDEVAA